MLNNKIILIAGGTGTIRTALINYLFTNYTPKIIIILSRDETKQFHLAKNIEIDFDF